jgi:hypothetical protein
MRDFFFYFLLGEACTRTVAVRKKYFDTLFFIEVHQRTLQGLLLMVQWHIRI